jgi:hypothetical protein
MFYFAAAETARMALLHCPKPSFNSPLILPVRRTDWSAIEVLMDHAVHAHLAGQAGNPADLEQRLHAQPVHDAFAPFWLPQAIFQRSFEFRIGQALWLYRDAAEQRASRDPRWPVAAYGEAVHQALGVDIEAFLAALIQLAGRARAAPLLSPLRLTPTTATGYDDVVLEKTRAGVLKPSAYASVFELLSGDPRRLNDWSLSELAATGGTAGEDPSRGPNPLLRYPLVRCFPDKSDFCVAPVPSMLLEWLYEPLVHQLFETCRKGGFSEKDLSELFEEYVGLLAERCSPPGVRWVPELELRRSLPAGRSVVDWAFVGSETAVLIDAKRAYVRPGARYRSRDEDWRTLRKDMARGLGQATDFWQSIQEGHVPQLRRVVAQAPFALIVTQGDSAYHTARNDWRAGVESTIPPDRRLPWVVLALDDYEHLMNGWAGHDEHWLRDALERMVKGERVRDIVAGQIDETSPLVVEARKFFDKLRTSMVSAAAG